MASFPTSLDSLTNPTASSFQNSPDHATQHINANDILESLEAKVGADSSAVTTSHDYKLSGVTGTDKAVSKTGTETLTNKRITKRVGTSASAASHTIDSDSYDEYTVTAQAEAVTFAAPSGTPTNGQTLVIRILDNGTARAITWNSVFVAIGVTLPTTTTISKYTYVGCIWNSTSSKWDVVAVCNQV